MPPPGYASSTVRGGVRCPPRTTAPASLAAPTGLEPPRFGERFGFDGGFPSEPQLSALGEWRRRVVEHATGAAAHAAMTQWLEGGYLVALEAMQQLCAGDVDTELGKLTYTGTQLTPSIHLLSLSGPQLPHVCKTLF